jgi:alpha-N-acetylglucosamine transferase
MFAYLFSAVIEFLFFVGACVLIYQVFLSDWLQGIRAANKERNSAKESANKIAQVKLVADDPKDIEKFISTNAQYLSEETVKKLVERIEMIKCDRIIYEDSLKKRVDDLAAHSVVEAELEAEEVPAKGRRRR